jgi:hypothetical protein
MNKRLLDLALEAHLVNYVDNETHKRYFVDGDLEQVEKYAELIARELLADMKKSHDFLYSHNTYCWTLSTHQVKGEP